MPAPTDFRATVERIVVDPTLPDLSLRQLAVLLIVRDEPKEACTVRGMADRLNISKPAITRATDRLVEAGYAKREIDPADKRSVFIVLVPKGRKFAATLPASEMRRAA